MMWVLRMTWYFQSPEASKAFHSGKTGQLNWVSWVKSKKLTRELKLTCLKRIYFVDHLYIETFLLPARRAAGSTVRSDVRGTTGS